jgi:hypothetical protein
MEKVISVTDNYEKFLNITVNGMQSKLNNTSHLSYWKRLKSLMISLVAKEMEIAIHL